MLARCAHACRCVLCMVTMYVVCVGGECATVPVHVCTLSKLRCAVFLEVPIKKPMEQLFPVYTSKLQYNVKSFY